jgi:DNA (cytosine-5)-methyltransferase 1
MRDFRFVDLFSGAGGFTEGFLLAGNESLSLDPIAASDINATAVTTYRNRFQHQLGIPVDTVVADIRDTAFDDWLRNSVLPKLDDSDLDVVCGGPPCQGFSVFGARKQDDPRNDLVLRYLATIEALAPKYFVIENVPGLARMYKGVTVERLYEAVEAMRTVKYRLAGPTIVNAADYGVPQTRERILFFGSRFDMPEITGMLNGLTTNKWVTVGEALSDLSFLKPWESADDYSALYPARSPYQRESRRGRVFSRRGICNYNVGLANHEAAKHTPDVLARFSVMEPGGGLETIPAELWTKHLKTSKKWCVRLTYDTPSYTMVTLPDDFVHPTQPRILTVREMARLQSFDDTFVFLGPRSTGGGGAGNRMRTVQVPQYSQVGNAVPPLLAKAIGDTLLAALTL